MKTVALALCLVLAGCVVPREPSELPSRACPPLPLLPDSPTTAQHRTWTNTVITLYVQCAKAHP